MTLLLLAQILTMVIWMLICWPVYRAIHQVSRLRSAVAYVLAFAAVLALAPVFTLLLRGLHAGNLPTHRNDTGQVMRDPPGRASLELRVARPYSSARREKHQLDRACHA